ncbi:MAG: hypothetical protein ACOZCO_13955 [Bacteroidota bacterium]
MKPIECPNCGGNNPVRLSEGEYRCSYCDSLFHLQIEKPRSTPLEGTQQRKFEQYKKMYQQGNFDPQKTARKIRIFVFLFFIIMFGIGISITLYTMSKVTEQITTTMSGIPQDGDWQAPTVSRFYVFEGSQGPVIWSVIQQTRQRLDSARFYVSLTDPVKNKEITTEKIFPTMTWDESFHFSDRWGELTVVGDTVWVDSKTEGLHARNLYSGEIIIDMKFMVNKFPQLKKGIASSQYQNWRRAFELLTDDGLKFLFVPAEMKVLTENEFDGNKDKVEKTFYVIMDENRPFLMRIHEKTEKYRLNPQTFIHDPGRFFKNKRHSNNDAEVDSVRTKDPLFGVNVLWSDDESVIALYRESLKKESKVHITRFDKDGSQKWDITGKSLGDFNKVFSDDIYVVTHAGKKEIALSYQRAKRYAIGIDIEKGKVNWAFEE